MCRLSKRHIPRCKGTKNSVQLEWYEQSGNELKDYEGSDMQGFTHHVDLTFSLNEMKTHGGF